MSHTHDKHKHHEDSHKRIEEALHAELRRFLSSFLAGEVVAKRQKVLCVSESDTVEHTLQLLNKHRILSVPVLRKEEKKDAEHPFVGIANLWDIVTAVCFQGLFDSYADEKMDKQLLEDDVVTEGMKLDVFKEPVSSILGLSEESKTLWVFNWDDSLDKLLDAFSKGVHRVLVHGLKHVDGQPIDSEYRFLSQTDVVRFLYTAQDEGIKHLLNKSLKEIGLIRDQKLHAATTDNSAITGFRKLTLHDVSAVPVVDGQGKLVDTVSVSDIRGLSQATFKYTLLPVCEFLEMTSGGAGKRQAPVTCVEGDKFEAVVDKVVKQRVHRAWVVDKDGKPVGCISLTDIICKFSPYDYIAPKKEEGKGK